MCEKGRGGTLPYALLILLQSVLYGFGNPLSKIGFRSITVLWCLGIRFSGAAILMLLLFGRRTVRSLRAAPVKAWLPWASPARPSSWPAWCGRTGRADGSKNQRRRSPPDGGDFFRYKKSTDVKS